MALFRNIATSSGQNAAWHIEFAPIDAPSRPGVSAARREYRLLDEMEVCARVQLALGSVFDGTMVLCIGPNAV